MSSRDSLRGQSRGQSPTSQHPEEIELRFKEIAGGVRVIETSPDPQVVLLIRQHAHRAVSEFVAAGMQRAMRPTPLPRRYRR